MCVLGPLPVAGEWNKLGATVHIRIPWQRITAFIPPIGTPNFPDLLYIAIQRKVQDGTRSASRLQAIQDRQQLFNRIRQEAPVS